MQAVLSFTSASSVWYSAPSRRPPALTQSRTQLSLRGSAGGGGAVTLRCAPNVFPRLCPLRRRRPAAFGALRCKTPKGRCFLAVRAAGFFFLAAKSKSCCSSICLREAVFFFLVHNVQSKFAIINLKQNSYRFFHEALCGMKSSCRTQIASACVFFFCRN